MTNVSDYLVIPEEYGRWLGDLRWSPSREVVEFRATEPEIGPTFAFSQEIGQFLEGLASEGELPHFAHVLHLMDLMGYGLRRGEHARLAPRLSGPFVRLAQTFREAGRPLRNAGVFCTQLCQGIPRAPDPPPMEAVSYCLAKRLRLGGVKSGEPSAIVPSLGPEEFENRIEEAIRHYSDADLESWLRHGRGPVRDAGQRIATLTPNTITEMLAQLEEHPRLKGARSLSARLGGALCLPPRRLSPAGLPVGGYSDVATRGLPEQILPTQFALDTDEFLRRFAERELLYYHREEPRAPTARAVILVLDQGVRTWGDVRLVLASAALALACQAERRGQSPRFAATSQTGPSLDATSNARVLTDLLAASDLTANPAKALGSVLLDELEEPRDVVLLTHPRNLAEPEITAVARRAGPATRLFAVTVEPAGAVELSELRDGRPVVVARCRVDMNAPASTDDTSRLAPRSRASAREAWTGDIEPVGFPFRIGPTEVVEDHLFAFDDAGEWLLIAGRGGLLRLCRVDRASFEMLPRAFVDEEVVTSVEAVVGVAGGFVVIGAPSHGRQVAAHYDVRSRVCRVYLMPTVALKRLEWAYVRRQQTVVGQDSEASVALELGTDPPRVRIVTKFDRERGGESWQSLERLDVLDDGRRFPDKGRCVHLQSASGVLTIRGDTDDRRSFRLMSDGKPRLAQGRLIAAVWRGEVLGVIVQQPDKQRILFVFTVWADWRLFGEYVLERDCSGFAMSRDGRRVAWRSGDRQILVRDLEHAGPPLLLVAKGRVHSQLELELGRGFLVIQAGRHAHAVCWDSGRLALFHIEGTLEELVARIQRLGPISPTVRAGPDHRGVPYARTRFYASAELDRLLVGVDRLGQVAIFDRAGELIVLFFVFRSNLAAWMPDGTILGPSSITGRTRTADAEARIGEALRFASNAPGRSAANGSPFSG